MHFKDESINTLYQKLAEALINKGKNVESRGLNTKEILFTTIELTNPYDRIVTLKTRNLSMKYFVGELCFYLSMSNKLNFISYYSKFWNNISDNNYTVNSAYGYRIFYQLNSSGLNQIEYAYSCLLNDKHTRKAIVQLASPNDSKKSKDNICTIYLNFFIRDNKLILKTQMRSNDFWLGIPYDISFFTILQEMLFVSLKKQKYHNLEIGSYYHFIDSMHVYNKNISAIKNLILENNCTKIIMPKITFQDIKYNFEYLLKYEKLKRHNNEDINVKSDSDFQSWCIKYL